MAEQKGAKKGGGRARERGKYLGFGFIPLMAVILIIVILAADSRQKGDSPSVQETTFEAEPTEDMAGNEETSPGENEIGQTVGANGESQGDSESAQSADPAEYPLLQDTMMELNGLVQMYCDAKKECDPDLLAQVFGNSGWTEEQKDEERKRMELVKASVKSYENISCYWIQGMEEDSYVIFPYYEIRFRETETLMPSLSWGYVRKNEDGQYYIVADTDETINDYMQKAGEKPEVKAVMAQVQAQQQEAVASDEILQKIYGGGGGSEVVIGGAASQADG